VLWGVAARLYHPCRLQLRPLVVLLLLLLLSHLYQQLLQPPTVLAAVVQLQVAVAVQVLQK
jgi:hypothetical protein